MVKQPVDNDFKAVEKIHKIVAENHRLKVRQIKDIIVISIKHKHLEMKTLWARYVPRLLKVIHKPRRNDVSVDCLKLFKLNTYEFYNPYISTEHVQNILQEHLETKTSERNGCRMLEQKQYRNDVLIFQLNVCAVSSAM